jgi:hypothetical protein
MWIYSDIIDVCTKHSVLQHATTFFTNYNITIKVEVRWKYLLTTTTCKKFKKMHFFVFFFLCFHYMGVTWSITQIWYCHFIDISFHTTNVVKKQKCPLGFHSKSIWGIFCGFSFFYRLCRTEQWLAKCCCPYDLSLINCIWVKSQRAFLYLDDMGHVRWNIVKMTISRSYDIRTMSTRQKCKKSKNQKKTKKHVFFKFLTRVKSNMCKKWGVGSTYTLL